MTKPIILTTDSLWSKWGFEDGDVLYDPLWDYEEEQGLKFDDLVGPMNVRHVLAEVVRRHLLPALNMPVEVHYHASTCHNPIRAIDWHESSPPEGLLPHQVEVTIEQVLEVARSMPPEPEGD